jgi:hypothetical protein
MAFTLTYNPNGATGGSVPTDGNSYAAGSNAQAQGGGGLVKGSQTFCYWNTKADDSGTVFLPNFNVPMNSNVTLFAQWQTNAGLTGGGATANYNLFYDASLSAAAGKNIANGLTGGVADGDFNIMNGWFGNPGLGTVTVTIGATSGGAAWSGSTMATFMGGAPSVAFARYLMTSEVVEMFMAGKANGWGYSDGDSDEGSKGEGLSRFLGFQMALTQGLPTTVANGFFVANNWLNSGRADFVNNDPDDNFPDATTGCTTLFVYYLFDQLKFSIPSIINAGATTLAGVYTNLTGDGGNPFPFFKRLLDNAFPGTNQITTGPNFDDPFPLGLLSFWVDNNTFSKDQVKDYIATQGGVVSPAFFVVLEGFSIDSFNAYGVKVPTPTWQSPAPSGIHVQPTPGATPIFENAANPKAPQRIRFSFDLKFDDESAFPAAVGDDPTTAVLNAKAQIGGTDLNGATASLGFEFLAGANPYFTNEGPDPGAEAYLSQDLRVFSLISGQSPMPGAPAMGSDPYGYIQNLIHWMNHQDSLTQPFTGADPLNQLPGQTGFDTADSSVNPGTFFGLIKFFNFAVARVRLRGTALDQATACRVFFRLFVGQSFDTDFQPNTTYKSKQGTSGADLHHPVFPEPSGGGLTDPAGNTLQTIPFFATDINGTHDYDGSTPDANIRDVQIPATKDQVFAYYACFLDIYDPAGNAKNLAGTHHCLVAEIACSEAPIPTSTPTGAAPSPLTWDQMAQRNMQITLSENPKSRATHVCGQAFDLRPGPVTLPNPGAVLGLPDEIMIEWGNTPPGSTATIYWPSLDAHKVISLADSFYATHLLKAAGAHTIECETTKGVTYIPIPHLPPDQNVAGLFTIDLPDTIHHGQEFNVLVRRYGSRRGHGAPPPPPPPPPPKLALAEAAAPRRVRRPRLSATSGKEVYDWRQAYGAFNVRIPVTDKAQMLPREQDTLAILKWRLKESNPLYRWRPIWERMIELTSARVKGLGGDPEQVPPSLGGYPPGHPGEPGRHPGHHPGHHPGPHHGEPGQEHRRDHEQASIGKVEGVVYDRFGDFSGFRLLTEWGERRRYRAREAEVQRLVVQAWRRRWVIEVIAERDDHDRDDPPMADAIILVRGGDGLDDD